jgi:hypothetical protein
MHVMAGFYSNTSLSADRDEIPAGLAVETSLPLVFNPSGLSQHEVLEDEISLAAREKCFARSTRHVMVNRFGLTTWYNAWQFGHVKELPSILVPIRCSGPIGLRYAGLSTLAMSLDCHSRQSDY